MAASFPNAKKTFSAVVNGVTKLVAALFNTPYDEIEAIETYIGATGGGTQAYSESLKGLLIAYRRGCNVEYKGTADLYVRLGEICIPDASGNIRLRRNTTDTTVTWANIDTGAEEASTIYYVYAVADASATTFTVMISKSATTPTGATFYKLLGSFYNDASSNIEESKITNNIPYKVESGFWKHSGVEVYNSTIDSSWRDIDCSSVVGAKHALVMLRLYVSGSYFTEGIAVRPKGETKSTVAVGTSYANGIAFAVQVSDGAVYLMMETDENGIVQVMAPSGSYTASIIIQGYII